MNVSATCWLMGSNHQGPKESPTRKGESLKLLGLQKMILQQLLVLMHQLQQLSRHHHGLPNLPCKLARHEEEGPRAFPASNATPLSSILDETSTQGRCEQSTNHQNSKATASLTLRATKAHSIHYFNSMINKAIKSFPTPQKLTCRTATKYLMPSRLPCLTSHSGRLCIIMMISKNRQCNPLHSSTTLPDAKTYQTCICSNTLRVSWTRQGGICFSTAPNAWAQVSLTGATT